MYLAYHMIVLLNILKHSPYDFWQAFAEKAMSATDGYSAEKDSDLVTEAPDFKDEQPEVIFKAGQSKRVWGELYKVTQ